MGKMDTLVARASVAIPPEAPASELWESPDETPPALLEPPRALTTATRDDVREAANQAERETDPVGAERGEPPEPPEAPVLKVVEPLPVLQAVERLHQGVRSELRAVKAEMQGAAAVARRQEDYLREVQRAHNAMATDWYKIAEGLPAIRGALEELHAEIATRRTALTALREGAEEETRAALTMQVRELEAVLRRVRPVATRAVLLVALVSLLAVIAVAVLTTGTLHRPL